MLFADVDVGVNVSELVGARPVAAGVETTAAVFELTAGVEARDGAAGAFAVEGGDVADGDATATPLNALVVIAVVTPAASDLICAVALPIMIPLQSAATTTGDAVRCRGRGLRVAASACGSASADKIERRSNVKVVCMRCTPHPKQKVVSVN